MHQSVQNLISIQASIKSKLSDLADKERIPKIIAVSKTFKIDHILPLINYGHLDYGENKVQEAIEKWTDIKIKNNKINLHLIGKLQTNKVKSAVNIFDYIHSLDSEKLAKKIADEQNKQNKKIKIFIQINLGEESQKSGINKNNLLDFHNFTKELGLNIIGTMCIPPFGEESSKFFSEMRKLNETIDLSELSMGMSSDYLNAVEYKSTYLRIGSSIFGKRD
jgi:pyridoxal phosphate enzyme (YggS family)